ncbi:DNA polymerase delta subunit [Trifolium repens]|nr:DNA polymerase delta subunit [Trifolium repens]
MFGGNHGKGKKTPVTTKSKKPPIHTSNAPQPPPAVASRNTNQDLQDEHTENEKMLQQFDMNMKYEPV